MLPENQGTAFGRGEVEALKAGSLAKALALSGDPCRAWQALNKPGFVTGLLEIQRVINRKPGAAVPGTHWVRPGRGLTAASEISALPFTTQLVFSSGETGQAVLRPG